MNAIRRIAAAIRSSFYGLKPNWAILSAWAVMEVAVSAYFGWNLFWFSDAELLADCVLFVVFVLGIYAPAAPVTNVTNHFSGCECKDAADDEDEGCRGYGCDGCKDCTLEPCEVCGQEGSHVCEVTDGLGKEEKASEGQCEDPSCECNRHA